MQENSTHKDDEQLSYDALKIIDDIELLRVRLKLLIQQAVDDVNAHPELAEQRAYDLAGLLALYLVRQLSADDPYLEILEMAGQLELPKRHQSEEASWSRLAQLARILPD